MSDKRVFTASDGREYALVKPSVQLLNEAARVRQRVFNRAFEEGGLLRQQVEQELKNRNLWNEKLQAEYDSTQLELVIMINKLEEGGIKLSEARELAIDIAEKRQALVDMLVDRSELDNMTCEGQADSERFNFLFANCLVYNDTGEKVFNNLEEYVANPSHPGAQAGSSEFYYLLTNSENIQDTLPENQFLKKYKFIDEQSRFVERGTERLVDVNGKYVDEEGYYIEYDADGNTYRINNAGEKIEEIEQAIEVETQKEALPFLDDDGNPLDDDGNPVVVEKPKPKRKRRTTKKATAKADT